MKPNGWIIYNGSLKGGSFLDYASMLQEAMIRKNSQAKIISNTDLPVLLHQEQLELVSKNTFAKPDYVLFCRQRYLFGKAAGMDGPASIQ
ncbi:hypothetical protein RWE15_24505 [Virgibacillus halophilus]|uniref:Uncharacterized protein n=1 Tax=Tigheibacillus halophilus TaxID=361280 RepID=A0ABU5CD07_9BACI|nr:hypothetical protein [Virgibacillus halophilus]